MPPVPRDRVGVRLCYFSWASSLPLMIYLSKVCRFVYGGRRSDDVSIEFHAASLPLM